MSRDNRVLFVERGTYRRRRLVDAARVLPILGIVLVCLPLLWIGEREQPTSTTYAMIYFFGLWLVLVAGSALLFRYLRTDTATTAPGSREEQTQTPEANGHPDREPDNRSDNGPAGGA